MAHEGKILCVNVNHGNGQRGADRQLVVESIAAVMRELEVQPDVVLLQDLKW